MSLEGYAVVNGLILAFPENLSSEDVGIYTIEIELTDDPTFNPLKTIYFITVNLIEPISEPDAVDEIIAEDVL